MWEHLQLGFKIKHEGIHETTKQTGLQFGVCVDMQAEGERKHLAGPSCRFRAGCRHR